MLHNRQQAQKNSHGLQVVRAVYKIIESRAQKDRPARIAASPASSGMHITATRLLKKGIRWGLLGGVALRVLPALPPLRWGGVTGVRVHGGLRGRGCRLGV